MTTCDHKRQLIAPSRNDGIFTLRLVRRIWQLSYKRIFSTLLGNRHSTFFNSIIGTEKIYFSYHLETLQSSFLTTEWFNLYPGKIFTKINNPTRLVKWINIMHIMLLYYKLYPDLHNIHFIHALNWNIYSLMQLMNSYLINGA